MGIRKPVEQAARQSAGTANARPPGTADSWSSLFASAETIPAAAPEPSAGQYTPLHDQQQLTREHPDRYRTKSEFGRGGIGRVLLAYDRHLGREVAIKELLTEFRPQAQDSESTTFLTARDRFLREARITGQLEHPGVVPVYELGQHPDGSIYYTMKLVRGTTLTRRLQDASALRERLGLLPCFLAVCETMAYAHARGVIHRDLKPDNVMVGEFGETVVLDWGLARVLAHPETESNQRPLDTGAASSGPHTQMGELMGTLLYMSPEQTRGDLELIDKRSDVWSLGVILYQLLLGRLPFTGTGMAEILLKIQFARYVPPRQVDSRLPPELASIVAKCLQTDPRRRYPDARALADEIRQFQSGGIITAYAYHPGALLLRWIRRHRSIAAISGTAAILLAAMGLWAHFNISRQRDRADAARQLAEQREIQVRQSLSEALSEKGLRAAREACWPEARIFFSGAQEIYARPSGWLYLGLERQQPLRLRSVTELGTHRGFCIAAEVSPDERWAVSGGFDGEVRLWNLLARRPERELFRAGDWISSIAFRPDGKYVAAGANDGTVVLLETGAFTTSWVTRLKMKVRYLKFSPGGTHLVCAGNVGEDGVVARLLSADGTSGPVRTLHQGRINSLGFSPDERLLATASEDGTARIWHYPSWRPAARLPGTRGWLSAVAFSPDGREVAVGGSEALVQLYETRTFQETGRLTGHQGEIFSLSYQGPDQTLISASLDRTLRIWSLERRHCLLALTGHLSGVFCGIPFARGEKILSASNDGGVRLWELAVQPRPGHRWMLPDGRLFLIRHLIWVHDRVILAADREGRVALLDPGRNTCTILGRLPEPVSVLACSGGRDRVAAAGRDGHVRVWDLVQQRELASGTVPRPSVGSLAFLADGTGLAAGTEGGAVLIWDLAAGSWSVLQEEEGLPVLVVVNGPELLTIGGKTRLLRVYDLKSHRLLRSREGNPCIPFFAVLSPTRDYLAFSTDEQLISLHRLPDLTPARNIHGHEGEITSLAFSPDGTRLATSSYDGRIRLFSTRNWEELLEYQPDNGPIRSQVVFTPGGSGLAWGASVGGLDQIRLEPPSTGPGARLLLKSAEEATSWRLDRTMLVPAASVRQTE